MNEINKGFYAIIPANIRYDNDIPCTAKILYSEITALCNVKGYCWPNNEYFAGLYGVSERTICRWISKLVKKGYIFIEYEYKQGTKEISKRYIKSPCSTEPICEDIPDLGGDKNVTRYRQNCLLGGDKNVRDNNINIYNNINNNICHLEPEQEEIKGEVKDIHETVKELYIKSCPNLPKPIKLTDDRKKNIKKLTDTYTLEQIETAFKNINNSVFCTGSNDRGWKADFDFCISVVKVTFALEGKYKNQDKPQQAKEKPNNKFHNFDQKISHMGNEELEEKLRYKFDKKPNLLKESGKNDMPEL